MYFAARYYGSHKEINGPLNHHGRVEGIHRKQTLVTMLSETVLVVTGPAGHWNTSVVQLVGSCLSNCPGSRPITRTYSLTENQWPSKPARVKLSFVHQLLFRAIAQADADIIDVKTLRNVVDRVVATNFFTCFTPSRNSGYDTKSCYRDQGCGKVFGAWEPIICAWKYAEIATFHQNVT